MKGIVISGLPAVGKTTVAKAVAKRFGLKYYGGGDILKELAFQKGFKPSGGDWWDTSEGMKFFEVRKLDPSLDRAADKKLVELVKEGDVVVTSYPVPWLVKEGIKFWLKGSVESRAKRMCHRDLISFDDALNIIRKRDLENARWYKDLYGISFGEDLSVFNFVIDTGKLNQNSVIDIVCRIVNHFV